MFGAPPPSLVLPRVRACRCRGGSGGGGGGGGGDGRTTARSAHRAEQHWTARARACCDVLARGALRDSPSRTWLPYASRRHHALHVTRPRGRLRYVGRTRPAALRPSRGVARMLSQSLPRDTLRRSLVHSGERGAELTDELAAHLVDTAQRAADTHTPQSSGMFLRPYEVAAVQRAFANLAEVGVVASGGYAQAERCIVAFYRRDDGVAALGGAPVNGVDDDALFFSAGIDGDGDGSTNDAKDEDSVPGNGHVTGDRERGESDVGHRRKRRAGANRDGAGATGVRDRLARHLCDAHLRVVELRGNFLFDRATHRDFLGALLAATGLKRERLGDIIVMGDRGAQIVVRTDVATIVEAAAASGALTSVRSVPVRCYVLGGDDSDGDGDAQSGENTSEARAITDVGVGARKAASAASSPSLPTSTSSSSATAAAAAASHVPSRPADSAPRDIASLLHVSAPRTKRVTSVEKSTRVDAVASAAFGCSRSRMAEWVRAGDVQLNWQDVSSASKTLKAGDVVTVRGRGRMQLTEVDVTSRGRYRIAMERYM